MGKVNNNKLDKVNGGRLGFDPGGGNVKEPGIPSEVQCKKSFDSFVCNGCYYCTVTHNLHNTCIINFTCQKNYYKSLVYDLSKRKIIG